MRPGRPVTPVGILAARLEGVITRLEKDRGVVDVSLAAELCATHALSGHVVGQALKFLVRMDNTLLQGEPYLPGEPSSNGAAIASFNDAIAHDPRVEQVMLAVRDGMTLIRWA